MANVSSFSGAMPVIPGGLVELGYSQITSSVTVSSTTAGSGTEIIAPLTVNCDGGPVMVEFFAPQTVLDGTQQISFSLYKDGSEQFRQWFVTNQSPSSGTYYPGVYAKYRDTPTAGSHTYGVKAYKSSANTCAVQAGNSSTGNSPAFLRVSKIVNQNDGLKPFWTPPVVTQLPSQATVGDQVIYAADATNGVYWHLQYDGLGTYPWKFIGGAPLRDYQTGTVSTATSSVTTPNISIPLPGDYKFSYGAMALASNVGNYATVQPWWNSAVLPGYSSDQLECGQGINQYYAGCSTGGVVSTLTTTGTVSFRHASTSGTASFIRRWMEVTPVRVKAA